MKTVGWVWLALLPGLEAAAEEVVGPRECIALKHLKVADQELSGAEVSAIATPFIGQCLDKQQLIRIVDAVSSLYMDRGEITTRAFLKEQDVSDGQLEVSVLKGTLEKVVDGTTKAPTWRTRSAFAFQQGRVLNLRAIETSLEMMNRPPSSNVRFEILPGSAHGTSVVEIKGEEGRRSHLQLGVTGRHNLKEDNLSLTADASFDNPLELNDILTFRYNTSYVQQQYQGNDGWELGYSFPVSSWLFEIIGSEFSYRQGVEGLNDIYLSEGETRGLRGRVSRTVWRNQRSKLTPALSVYHKNTENDFAGERVDVSSYSTTLAQLDLRYSHVAGWGQFNALYSFYRGTDWFGARADGYLSADASAGAPPKLEFRKHSLDLGLTYPLRESSLTLSANYHLQYSDDLLFNSDQLTVGSDYSVRGYDDRSLYGNNAWYLNTNLAKGWSPERWGGLVTGASLYVGFDYGQARCEADEATRCGDVAGTAIGLDLTGPRFSASGVVSKPLKAIGQDFRDDLLFKFDLGWRF